MSRGGACPVLSLPAFVMRKIRIKPTVVITEFCIRLPVRTYVITLEC